MGADPGLRAALAVAAAVPAARATRLCITDPNGGAPIVGLVIGALSETHVSFRAEDGLIWPVAAASLQIAEPAEGAP